MKNILFTFFYSLLLINLSSCDAGFSDLDAVLDITGEKLNKGFARTGAAKGYSFWTFDGSDLKVEYTGQLNATIEQQILNSGDVYREVEEYTIRNLEPSYTYDEERSEVRKGYWGDWDNHSFYFGLNHGENGYYIKFQVSWNKGSYCTYTHELSGEDESKILNRFIITDESDENYIAAKDEVMRELNLERFKNLRIDKEELERILQDTEIPNQFAFNDKTLFFIDWFNATLDDSTEDWSTDYLDASNQEENSITIDNKKVSLNQFKRDILRYINDRVDSLDVLEYLYVTSNTYHINNGAYGFYFYEEPDFEQYSELGMGMNKNANDYRTVYKQVKEKMSDYSLDWKDIYLFLFKDETGKVNTYIYKFDPDLSKNRSREYYGLGNVYFSAYKTEYDEPDFYSLHDRLSIFANEYSFDNNNRRWGYKFKLEDFIGYSTLEYLQHRVTDFKFTDATSDFNYIAIKLSQNDKILSQINLERAEDSFSWEDLFVQDTLSAFKVNPDLIEEEWHGDTEGANESAPVTEEPKQFTSYYVDDPDGWVNLRNRPNGEIIKRVDNYEVGVKVEKEGDWILLRFADGSKGFIHITRLKEAP
tara:strand:- start:8085 stop:9854 length:1770 start_codon:yes stop_codon:yes gene_type:complete